MNTTLNNFSCAQQTHRNALIFLSLFHIFIIAASNYLVQIPLHLSFSGSLKLLSTWGALSFPFIFLATDLTVRLFGQALARRIIFHSMLFALLFSYVVSILFFEGKWTGWASLTVFNVFVGRIALASFCAYVFGQLLDITLFHRLRQLKTWWIAPAVATFFGHALDTLLFFSIAFYRSSDPFMAEHWPEIAWVDYAFKLLICMCFFLPLYGVLLTFLTKKLTQWDE